MTPDDEQAQVEYMQGLQSLSFNALMLEMVAKCHLVVEKAKLNPPDGSGYHEAFVRALRRVQLVSHLIEFRSQQMSGQTPETDA